MGTRRPRSETIKRGYEQKLWQWDMAELIVYIIVAAEAAIVTGLEYVKGPWVLPKEAELWCSIVILFVLLALLAMHVTVYIPRLQNIQEPDDSQGKSNNAVGS
jgi:uncharacterized membrane protein YhaH (DUF805 family)